MTPAEIKAFRKSHGYTQAEFAALIGLGDPSRISSIETGAKPISKQVAATMRMATALKSIADNTCCAGCREAGLVAAAALRVAPKEPKT